MTIVESLHILLCYLKPCPPLCPVIGFDPTTYEVTEREDAFVRMSLFRTGNTELSGSVTLVTIPDSAEG